MNRPNIRRGIYIIPTLMTMLNIFFGFRAIVASTRAVAEMTGGRTDLAIQHFETACLSLLIAEQNVSFLDIADRVFVLEGGRIGFAGLVGDLRQNDALARAYFGLK